MNKPSIAKLALLATLILLGACESDEEGRRLTGQLESDRIELSAEFAEVLTERFVAEGERVTAGTPVLQQQSDRATARVSEAEAALMQSTARLAELIRGPRSELIIAAQASLDGAKKDLEFRNLEFDRAQTLLDRELASEGNRDRAKAALDQAVSNADYARAQLEELLTGTTLEELEQARAAVLQAEAQLERLRIDAKRLTTVAPMDSVVDSLLFEPGERPPLGSPMAILLAGEQPYARVYVTEELRVHVRPGTAATVFVDGMDQPISGRVRWIASEASFTPYFALTEHDRGRLSFVAKIDLDYEGSRLPDGVPLEAELQVNGRD